MTLPASGPLSLTDVAAELGLSATGLSLGHQWVRQLAGQPYGSGTPVSYSGLRGQSAQFTGNVTFTMSSSNYGFVSSGSFACPFFGASTASINNQGDFSGSTPELVFAQAPNWVGNIILINNGVGQTTLTKVNATTWRGVGQNDTVPGGALPGGGTITKTMLIRPA
jgi:hypothetical protein